MQPPPGGYGPPSGGWGGPPNGSAGGPPSEEPAAAGATSQGPQRQAAQRQGPQWEAPASGGAYAAPGSAPPISTDDGYDPVPGPIRASKYGIQPAMPSPPHPAIAPLDPPGPRLGKGAYAVAGCSALALVSLVAALALALWRGEARSDERDDEPEEAPAEAVWIESSQPDVAFLRPVGWRQTDSGRWGVFKSPDDKAVLAVAGYVRADESTALIGEAARVLGVSQVQWTGTSEGTIGHDELPARIGKGVCNFRGEGYISYATLDPGGTAKLLVVYTVAADANDEHRAAVNLSLSSLRRR